MEAYTEGKMLSLTCENEYFFAYKACRLSGMQLSLRLAVTEPSASRRPGRT